MKCDEDILKGFQVTERTQLNCKNLVLVLKGHNSKIRQSKLSFLSYASCLMLVNFRVKFHEDSLSGF